VIGNQHVPYNNDESSSYQELEGFQHYEYEVSQRLGVTHISTDGEHDRTSQVGLRDQQPSIGANGQNYLTPVVVEGDSRSQTHKNNPIRQYYEVLDN